MADLQCKRSSAGAFKAMFARMADSVDAVTVRGDLVDDGWEAEIFWSSAQN
jgi:hypothetical protein